MQKVEQGLLAGERLSMPIVSRRATAADANRVWDILLAADPDLVVGSLNSYKGFAATSNSAEKRENLFELLGRNETASGHYSFVTCEGQTPVGFMHLDELVKSDAENTVIIEGWFTLPGRRSLRLIRSMGEHLFSMRTRGINYEYLFSAKDDTTYKLLNNPKIGELLSGWGLKTEWGEEKAGGFHEAKIRASQNGSLGSA